MIVQLPHDSRFKYAVATADERAEAAAEQQRTEARHSALEDQWRRNQERGAA